MNKVTVIGSGRVGSTIVYSLTCRGLADEIVLIDINGDRALGEDLAVRRRSQHPDMRRGRNRVGLGARCGGGADATGATAIGRGRRLRGHRQGRLGRGGAGPVGVPGRGGRAAPPLRGRRGGPAARA